MSALLSGIIFAVVLVICIYLLRKGVNVGYIMLIASATIIVIRAVPAGNALKYVLNGLVSWKTIKLFLLIFLIMILENIMRSTGMIKSMVDSLKQLVGSSRWSAALLPLVIGLLPSPGGARFSCPMVEEVTKDRTTALNKAFINYGFRHVWMDGFILYPGILIASELLNVTVLNFFLHLLPFMLLSAFMYTIFGLSKVRSEKILQTKSFRENISEFLKSLMPVLFVIAFYIIFQYIFKYSMETALIIVVIILFILKKYSFKKVWDTLKKAFSLKFALIIAGVMIFQEVLTGSGVMDGLGTAFDNWNIPVKILYIVLPFLAGFASGITVTGISIAFPVLIPLGLNSNLWYAVFSFVATFSGLMVSPLHLCAVMTSDYFENPLVKLLLKVSAVQAIIFVIVSVLIFIV